MAELMSIGRIRLLVNTGRAINSEEAKVLLAEIDRLKEIEKQSFAYIAAVRQKRQAGEKLHRLHFPQDFPLPQKNHPGWD